MRITYRVHQFWRAIFLQTDGNRLKQAKDRLTPAQLSLFVQLQPAEKNHALHIFHRLLEQGDDQPDLLTAALLHDVGKLHYRQSPLDRALVVLGKAIVPKQARHWGILPAGGWDGLPGWRKAFILAEMHAEWGAELALRAGTSPDAVLLIRQHHRARYPEEGEAFNNMLYKLWKADNES